jgi:ferrous iron transport protein B
MRKIALIGNPNVGKSVIFYRLTGTYATVSNYPGTTVEVTRGKGKIGDEEFEIIDTPGMYSLLPLSEDEKVTRSLIFNESPALVLHIIDAKNLERMLTMTLQLIEAGLSTILVLNIIDEAARIGLRIDTAKLEKELGIPMVATVSITGKGIDILKGRMERYVRESQKS